MKVAPIASRLVALLPVLVPLLLAAPAASSAATGEPRLQAYFQKDFTDAAYQQETYRKVAAAWKRPKITPSPGSKAVVIAVLAKDGSLAGATLHMKSGVAEWDESILAAVRASAPFGPLPGGYPNATTEVHFHLEWVAATPKKP